MQKCYYIHPPANVPRALAEYFNHHATSSLVLRSSFGFCNKELKFLANDYKQNKIIWYDDKSG